MGRALVPGHLDHRPAAADHDARGAQRRHRPRRAHPRHRVVRLAGAQPAGRHPRAQLGAAWSAATCAPRSPAPREEAARAKMAQASLQAGLAFTNAILGATHAMSHQVGGLLDAPHGVVNGVLLPHVIRYNARATPRAVRRAGPGGRPRRSTACPARRPPRCWPSTCASWPTTSACPRGCATSASTEADVPADGAHHPRRRLPDHQPPRRRRGRRHQAVPGRPCERDARQPRTAARASTWRR